MFGGSAALILTVSITAATAAQHGFSLLNFNKLNGAKHVQEGVLVDVPTRKDKENVVNSIDPKTGAPVLKLTAKAGDKKVLSKTLIAEDTGKSIDIPYVKENTKDVAIYDPVKTLWTIPIPGTNEYLISFDGTIYKTDWKSGKLKNFLKDEVNGYKKNDVLSRKFNQNETPVWAVSPVVNPSGTFVLFFSDRSRVLDGGDENGETWVKDLRSGEEYPVKSGGIGEVLGWISEATVVLNGIQTISLNVQTKEIKVHVEETYNTSLVKDHIVYQISPGSLTFQSLVTGEKTVVTSSLLNRTASFQARGSWLAISNQMRDGEMERSILLYNVETKVWKEVTAPESVWIDGFSWKDDSTLLVQTSKKGTIDEATYLVDINELEVQQ